YDTYITEVQEDNNGILWLGALERLIRWDKKNNQIKFFYYYAPPSWKGSQNLEIRSVCNDSKGRIWVSALGDGIAILNETTGQFKKVPRDTSLSPAVKSNYINQLYSASDGNIWVGSNSGMYTIDPATLKINAYTN